MNARLLLLSLLGFVLPYAHAAQQTAQQAVPFRAPARQPPGWPAPATDDVYLPGIPEVVCGALPTNDSFSPDGRYIIAIRKWSASPLSAFTEGGMDWPESTTSVIVWSAVSHRSTAVWSQDSAPMASGRGTTRIDVTEPEWMHGSHYAFFLSGQTGDEGFTLWRVDARQAAAVQVAKLAHGEALTISPTRPIAFITGTDEQGAYLKPITNTGAVGQPIRLGLARTPGMPLWSTDGTTLYTIYIDPPAGNTPEEASKSAPVEDRYAYAYDTRTGKATRQAVPDRSKLYMPAKEHAASGADGRGSRSQALKLARSDIPLLGSEKETAHAVWLEETIDGKVQRFLVTADGAALLSPARDAVMYKTREGVFVLPLLRIPHAVYQRAHERAVQAQVLNNVKQVAIAAIMYAQDYDGNLPATGADIRNVLKPYAKSDDIFNGPDGNFVYTFQGGPINDVKNPAGTVIGYMPVIGGYGVAYLDGHVQWLKQLPNSEPGP